MSQQVSERAVIAVDFDDGGDDAILEGLRWLSRHSNRVVHALHVIDPDKFKDNPIKPPLLAKEEALAQAPVALAHWIEELARSHQLSTGSGLRTHARIGKPVDTVLQFATDYDADIIVVGTHGRRGLERLLLGSVAEMLVRTARCPVLVARPKNYEGAKKTVLPDLPYPPGEEPEYPPREISRTVSTQSDIWQPSGGRPTGFRIV